MHLRRQDQRARAAAGADLGEKRGEIGQRLGPDGGAAAHQRPQVALRPHHALGVAGGAAGIDEQQVVGAVRLRRQGDAGGRGRLKRRAGLEDQPESRQARDQCRDHRGELGIVDEDGRVAVVEDVVQLLAGVAIVDVDVDEPRLERRDGGLGIGGTVAAQDRDLVTRRGPGGEEGGGQRVGAADEIAPRRDPVAVDKRRCCGGNGRSDRREDRPEAVRHVLLPSFVGDSLTRPAGGRQARNARGVRCARWSATG